MEYISRLRSTRDYRILEDLAAGRVDILIGTTAFSTKSDIQDLGLLIIDEEQFESPQEKIRQMKSNVDTLPHATPIPELTIFAPRAGISPSKHPP